MLQPRGDADLAGEAVDAERGGELAPKDLHRDLAPVLQVLGHEHSGHAALAQLALDAVGGAEGALELAGQIGGREAVDELGSEGM
jgi:hypothetical protein